MMRIIVSEWKKLFKSKFNIILPLLLIGFIGVQTYDVYHNSFNRMQMSDSEGWIFQDETGKNIDSDIAYFRLADQIHHRFKGTLTPSLMEQQVNQLTAIRKRFPRKTMDDSYMTELYGKDYEHFIESAKQGEFSSNEIWERLSSYGNKVHGYETENGEGSASSKMKAYFVNYYQEDHVRSLYETIYLGGFSIPSVRMDAHVEATHTAPFSDALQPLEASKLEEGALYSRLLGGDIKEIKTRGIIKEAKWYVNKYKESPLAYDSVVGNTLFIKAIENFNIWSLLVIVILLANVFAMEVTHKTDQIMVPTKTGNLKITMAKIIAGVSVAFGLILVQFLLMFIMSLLYLPMRNLNLQYFGQAGIVIVHMVEWMFTYKEIILNAFAFISIASIATAMLTLGLSYLSKNRFITVVIMLLFTVGGFVAGNLISLQHYGNEIYKFFPAAMTGFTQFFGFLSNASRFVPFVSLQGNIIAWKDIIMMTWCILLACITSGLALHAKRHIVKNK